MEVGLLQATTRAGCGMNQHLHVFAEWCATGIEAVGIAIITLAALQAVAVGMIRRIRSDDPMRLAQDIRQSLGRGILLGLEFLVAADIITTVAVELTLESVSVLGLIVLIRTFLSFALEVELDGRWPWQSDGK